MKQRVFGSAIAATAIALALAGCGSSQSASPAIRRAADVTAQTPGYKLSGSTTITVNGPQQHVVVTVSVTGSFDRRDEVGAVTAVSHVAGREGSIRAFISHLTLYMPADVVPNASTLTGGKPWIALNISRAIPGGGVGGLSTITDPSQFLDYLRAVSSSTTNRGIATIRGVRTTHYYAVIDLSRYPNLVPPAQRKGAAEAIKTLEAVLGSHSLPADVWIDGDHLVRQERFAFTECLAGVHQSVAVTQDLYDYGPQAKLRVPPAREVYNLNPQLSSTLSNATSALSHAKLGCSS